ncbi:MAG: sugar phosphate isomerase/epimerase [Acidobacteria bacterium]|nr:sugar phosphate isomerase/epimerase [Acidobacteriota bacterium]
MYSRRDFGKAALAALGTRAMFGKVDSKVNGVQLGAVSYSFRDRSLDDMIKAMVEIGLGECELWQGHVEPQPKARGRAGEEELQHWRESTPDSYFQEIARKFKNAGIQLFASSYAFRDNYTDKEIESGFRIARALGVKVITSSATVSVTKRVAPFAEKYKIVVGMHGHSNIENPNEFARPESFEKAMAYSRYIGVNLDIGHFFAAGYDPVDYIRKHHDRIVCIHVKDRKKNQGQNVPFGEGDTPVKETLQLLKQSKWNMPANIEYEYNGGDTVVEVRRCYEFCKQALA